MPVVDGDLLEPNWLSFILLRETFNLVMGGTMLWITKKFQASSSRPSRFQCGCSKPPTTCNFTIISESKRNKPQGFTNASIDDRNSWKNDPSFLFSNYQSCKTGVLANLKNDWKKVVIVNAIFLIFLVIFYSIRCCTFRNNRNNNSQGIADGAG